MVCLLIVAASMDLQATRTCQMGAKVSSSLEFTFFFQVYLQLPVHRYSVFLYSCIVWRLQISMSAKVQNSRSVSNNGGLKLFLCIQHTQHRSKDRNMQSRCNSRYLEPRSADDSIWTKSGHSSDRSSLTWLCSGTHLHIRSLLLISKLKVGDLV